MLRFKNIFLQTPNTHISKNKINYFYWTVHPLLSTTIFKTNKANFNRFLKYSK